MRRLLVVPILLGMLLSLFPTVSLAQQATPVIPPTTTEAPSELPAQEIVDTPTSEEVGPASGNASPGTGSKIQSEEGVSAANQLLIDSEPNSKFVALSSTVTIEATNGGIISSFPGHSCDDETVENLSSLQATSSVEDARSYKANWADQSSSDCLTVVFTASTSAQILINGGTQNLRVDVGDSVDVVPTNVATFVWTFQNAACSEGALQQTAGPQVFTSNIEEEVLYVQARWAIFPDGENAGPCLHVVWRDLPPFVEPVIAIEGAPQNQDVFTGVTLQVTTEAGASIWEFTDATCQTNGNNLETATYNATSDIETTRYYRPQWDGWPNAPKGRCVFITWADPAIAPTLTLNEASGNRTVDINTTVSVLTQTGATIWQFTDATCQTNGTDLETSQHDASTTVPTTRFYKAVWIGFEDAPKSPCRFITWEDLEPTDAPPLTTTGGNVNWVTDIGGYGTVDTESGADIWQFTDATCETGGINHHSRSLFMIAHTETTRYFKAVWTGFPNAPESPCRSITWVDSSTPRTVAPPISLNRGSVDVSVDIDTEVEVFTQSSATIWQFTDATCDSDGTNLNTSYYTATAATDTRQYFQAIWLEYPTAPPSDCLGVTWGSPAPAVAPTLTLDGESADLLVDTGAAVDVRSETDSTIWQFSDATCETGGTNLGTAQHDATSTSEATKYFKAIWAAFPSAPASDCLAITWETPAPAVAPILTLDGESADLVVDTGAAVDVRSETGSTIWQFSDATCETGRTNLGTTQHDASSASEATQYFQAIWTAFPTTPASECLAITWIEEETPPAAVLTIVRVNVWDGRSLEGANWSLYAPEASQTAGAPYLTGELDADNSATFSDLPAGTYRIVVEITGLSNLDELIVITDESQEIMLQYVQPMPPETPAPTTEPMVPATPTAEPTSLVSPTTESIPLNPDQSTDSVTALPETGSGSLTGSDVTIALGLLAAMAMAFMVLAGRHYRRS